MVISLENASILLLIIFLSQKVKSQGKLAIQELQSIIIKLNPESDITTLTNLSVTGTNKFGLYYEFDKNDLFSISKGFNKIFSYSPWDKKVQINLNNFLVKHLYNGIFTVYCVFRPEIDGDTHWEVFWFGKQGEDVPMTSFFVKADLPTVMEVWCREVYKSNCYSLVENDDVIITCVIKVGMPYLTAYLEIPPEASPVILLKSDRRIEARIKLLKASYYKKLVCGADGENLTVGRPFEFLFETSDSDQRFDPSFVTAVVATSTLITIVGIFFGIYLVLVKPSKERGKEKVTHHVEISSPSQTNRLSMATAIESRKSLVRMLSKRTTSVLD